MKTLLLVLFTLSTVIIFSQEKSDTTITYFNKDWKISTKDSAKYYRIAVKENDLYKINDYYLNGKLQMTGHSRDNVDEIKEGEFSYYYEDGILSLHGTFVANKKEGEWKDYYSTGELATIENYSKGIMNGETISYYKTGEIKRKAVYSNGKILNNKYYTKDGKKIKIPKKDQVASYKGGQKKMTEFILKNLKYPPEAIERNIQGKVFVGFLIDIEGNINDIKVLKSVHPILDKAAIELVKKMPPWNPTFENDMLLQTRFQIPINFKLD